MTYTRGNCKFNFVPCSVIHILFAGNIMNMFALQTPCPVEQLKDKGRENSKAQLRRWINAGLISGSAKDSIAPFVHMVGCIAIEGQQPHRSGRETFLLRKGGDWEKCQKNLGALPGSLEDLHSTQKTFHCIFWGSNQVCLKLRKQKSECRTEGDI